MAIVPVAVECRRAGFGRRLRSAAPSRWAPGTRAIVLPAVAYAVVLLAASARYGYHRDELYFRLIGAHPAFGYDDQPPLVPLLDHALDVLGGRSLVVLRLPAAIAGAFVVAAAGLLCRRFGGNARAQALAAGTTAVSAYLVSVGHLATTTIFDCLIWAVLSLVVLEALRGRDRAWPVAGVVVGVGAEIKTLALAFAVVLVFWAVVDRRRLLASRPLWFGVLIAAVLAAPDLVWQQAHGWPQLQLSRAIAAGTSGTSQSPWVFLPFLLVLVSPVLAPVWLIGLWRLAADRQLRPYRPFAATFITLVVAFIGTGGKPYYVAGLFPVLIAAGAPAVADWARRGRRRARSLLLGGAVAVSALVSAVLMLPVIAPGALPGTPIVAINYDAGEQIGWPGFADQVAGAVDRLPGPLRARTVVLAGNYGEAGALARYRPDVAVYGAQNSLWNLGRPPRITRAAVVVGVSAAQLHRWFARVVLVGVARNPFGVDNDEQGRPIRLCARPRLPWAAIWRAARRLS